MKYKIVGIAQKKDYNNYNGDCPYSQIILEEEYNLLPEAPDVRNINQITAKPIILEKRLLSSSPRPKILVKGQYNIIFEYTATHLGDPIHSYSVEKFFETFLELPYYEPDLQIKEIHLLLEDLHFQRIHGRKFRIFLLIFAYANI